MSNNQIWSTITVNEQLARIEAGLETDTSCFYEGDPSLRKAEINFKYTKEEQKEIARCANDILYYADKYCFAMTDNGIAKINLRPYQNEMLKEFQENRFLVLLAARQCGKCHIFSSKINIYDKNKDGFFKLSIGKLYYLNLKLQGKLSFIQKLKYGLWCLYDKL